MLLRDDGWWRTTLFACSFLISAFPLTLYLSLSHTHIHLLTEGHESFRGWAWSAQHSPKPSQGLTVSCQVFTQQLRTTGQRHPNRCNMHYVPYIYFIWSNSYKSCTHIEDGSRYFTAAPRYCEKIAIWSLFPLLFISISFVNLSKTAFRMLSSSMQSAASWFCPIVFSARKKKIGHCL